MWWQSSNIVCLVRMASYDVSTHCHDCEDPSEPDTNDGRNGAVDDTVLSKITTKRSFTVLWHLSEPPSPRFYLGSGQCEKRGGSLILWSVNVIMIPNAVLSFMCVYKWIAKHYKITYSGNQIDVDWIAISRQSTMTDRKIEKEKRVICVNFDR